MDTQLLARVAAAATLLAGLAPAQTTWYVDATATGPGDGSQGAPFVEIQAAITNPATADGDTVVVLPGTYVENVDFLGKEIELRSRDGSGATTIDGNGLGSVVRLENGEGPRTELVGFTLTGGVAPLPSESGGGVFCQGSSPKIVSCQIVGNSAANKGGGLFAQDARVRVSDCAIEENFARFGAGVYADGSDLALIDSDVVRNGIASKGSSSTELGGGVGAWNSRLTVRSTRIAANQANYNGGGMYAGQSELRADGSEVSSNISLFGDGAGLSLVGTTSSVVRTTIEGNLILEDWIGGGAHIVGGLASFQDGVFRDNRAGEGGGLHVTNALVRIERCNFTGNSARDDTTQFQTGSGGAIYAMPGTTVSVVGSLFDSNAAHGQATPGLGNGGALRGPIEVARSTFVGNTAEAGGGAAWGASLAGSIAWGNLPDALAGGAVAVHSTIEGGWPGLGNLASDPMFWDAGGRDFHLLGSSPCIDTGDPSHPADADGSPSDQGYVSFRNEYCGVARSYCIAKPNSLGCVPEISFEGAPRLGGPSDFTISASNVINGQIGVLTWSLAPDSRPAFGGIACVAGPPMRTPVLPTGGNPPPDDCSGTLAFQFSSDYLGSTSIGTYAAIYAQFLYRDPQDPSGVGMTSAVRFVVCE